MIVYLFKFNLLLDTGYYGDGAGQMIEFTTPADVSGGGFAIRASSSSDNAFTLSNCSLKKRILL